MSKAYGISLNAEITNFSHNLRIDGMALGRHVTPHMKAYFKGYPIATPTRWHAPSKKGKIDFYEKKIFFFGKLDFREVTGLKQIFFLLASDS